MHIALLGDSIFDNGAYTSGGPDVVTQLRPLLSNGCNATLLAMDGAGTEDVGSQLSSLPAMSAIWYPSGFTLYLGSAFPEWNGDFFIGGMTEKSLRRIRMRQNQEVLQEILLRELQVRVRDVRTGPDGFLYLVTDDRAGSALRLRPKAGRVATPRSQSLPG